MDDGPLSAATATSADSPTSRAVRFSSVPMEAIAPCPDSRRRAWPRRATILAASSRVRIPATQAAAISPCECPATAAGRTPYSAHTAASDTITAHSTGCTTSTRANASSPARRTSVSDQST